MDERTGEMIAG